MNLVFGSFDEILLLSWPSGKFDFDTHILCEVYELKRKKRKERTREKENIFVQNFKCLVQE